MKWPAPKTVWQLHATITTRACRTTTPRARVFRQLLEQSFMDSRRSRTSKRKRERGQCRKLTRIHCDRIRLNRVKPGSVSRKDAKAQRKRQRKPLILCVFLCAFASLREFFLQKPRELHMAQWSQGLPPGSTLHVFSF